MTRRLIPLLSRRRIWTAMAIALAADGIQLLLGPVGWALVDEVVDVVAMVLLSMALRFHPLFLPTFVVEFIPLIDMAPTWTACTAIVIALRRKEQSAARPPESAASKAVIDI